MAFIFPKHFMEMQLLSGGLVFAADELEKRRRQRQKKVREEKRRERRIEMEENKKQGKCKWSGNVCRFSPEATD